MEKSKILIIGFAGQGALWLGKKIAREVLARDPKKFVSFLAEYEAGVRTGESRAQVVIGSEPIACPFIEQPDILVELENSQIKFANQMVELKGEQRVNQLALTEILKRLEIKQQMNK